MCPGWTRIKVVGHSVTLLNRCYNGPFAYVPVLKKCVNGSTAASDGSDSESALLEASLTSYRSVLVQPEMEKNFFLLVKIPPLRGGEFQGMRTYRAMPVFRSLASA